ncbi:MAG TPA: hypothetical protein VOA87_09600, partial [Thermoanaerobaculia bacterium]|nr:hypothetical protein [Thermoanaerobaculia bacterium]
MSRSERIRWVVAAPAAALLLARAAYLDRPFRLIDDAFISFRYAANLAAGKRLVWNPGERVEGYTNFLWTLLLAAGARAGLDLVVLSKLLAAAAGVGTVFLLTRLAASLPAEEEQGSSLLQIALPPFLFAAMGSQARYIVSGMETLLFVFLLVLALDLLFLRGRPALAGAVFAAAAMTRPEGVLYALLAGACFLSWGAQAPRPWPRLLRLAGGFVLCYLPYTLWRVAYYGHLFPNTYYVKAGGFSWARVARGAELLSQLATSWSVYPLLILALASLPSLRSLRGDASRRLLRVCWAYVVATVAYFLWVGGDFLEFFGPRFLMPALPALLLLAAQGLDNFLRWLAPEQGPRRTAAGAVAWAIAALLLANGLWLSWPARFSTLPGLAFEMEAWTRTGRWLRENTAPGAVLAVGAAGAIPYYSRRPAIDMFGLTDPHIAHLDPAVGGRPAAHEKFDPAYVLDRRPDFIVSTRLDFQGRPMTAGLRDVGDRLAACYNLFAVVKVRGERPDEGSWVVTTSRYRRDLYADGYRMGIFRRRHGPRAAQCAALE